MNERDELRLRHALEASERIASYLTGVKRDAFQANQMLQDAVIRNLEIIGEACVNLTPEFRDAHADEKGVRTLFHGISGSHCPPAAWWTRLESGKGS